MKYTPEMIDFILKNYAKNKSSINVKFKQKFGISKTVNALRKVHDMYKDIDFSEEALVLNEKKLYKEKMKLKDVVSMNRSLIQQSVHKDDFLESFIDIVKSIQPVKVKQYRKTKNVKVDRELTLVLSDLHFGSDISAKETGTLTYGKVEEARRFGEIIKQTCDYKLDHRSTTSLNVLLLGDIIQNQLHDPRDGAPIAEQVARSIYLINQGIARFSESFPEVRIICSSGNHGRATARHHGRATNQKWDSIETMVYYAVKESNKHLKNVTVEIPKTPYLTYEVFGHKIFATHGDSVFKTGYPGNGIRTGALENQINRINSTLKDSEEYSVFIFGHIHLGSIVHLGSGATMITNAALCPVDEFAVSIGHLESNAGQYLFESTKTHPVGDVRFIKVNKKTDADKSLDKVIQPFNDL